MKLIDALATIQRGRAAPGPPFVALLACGFTPLHLETFLAAHLQARFAERPVRIETGVYGNLAVTLERGRSAREAVTVIVEWADLDPRLGVRGTGGWRTSLHADIVGTVVASTQRLRHALEDIAARSPVVLCGPTLPLPPLAHAAGWQESAFESDLADALAGLMGWATRHPRLRVVRSARLDLVSPPGDRFDVEGELRTGFPYRLGHAEQLAGLLAALVENRPPKKGLITDLDDTLWRGLVGENGVSGVSWDLDHGAHVHALYQQLLAALAERGVLIGVVSKNDPAVVEDALRRPDLLVPRDSIHPVQAGWGAKSEAVRHVLRAWNIGADSVVFVDDTPMELAEVAAAHPGIECVRFPGGNAAAVWTMLEQLRDLFGKATISDEDRLRGASLRAAPAVPAESDGAAFEAFLATAAAVVTLDFTCDAADPRALELVNKTNQFNLNGRRYTEAQWRALLTRPGAFLLRVSYEDRFGRLGKIAIAAGRHDGDLLDVDAWVMSCRAFSRRIEFQCLARLFERFGASTIAFDYAKTDRNGPLQECFAALLGTSPPGVGVQLTRAEFGAACPALHHTIHEVS